MLAEGKWEALPAFDIHEGDVVGEDHGGVNYPQDQDHDSYEEGRNTCNHPQDNNLKRELLVGFVNPSLCLNCGRPVLKQPQRHVEGKQIKGLLILVANTILSPHAVMIHLHNASATSCAMRHPWRLIILTVFADFGQIVRRALISDGLPLNLIWDLIDLG